MNEHPRPPFPKQQQPMPGATQGMEPRPEHGETSYKGSVKLAGLKAVITGGDSGTFHPCSARDCTRLQCRKLSQYIGRAVAIAFARKVQIC
jgi:hypothetical protein